MKDICMFSNVRRGEFGLYLNGDFVGKYSDENELYAINKQVGILNINSFVKIQLRSDKYHDWYYDIKGFDYPKTVSELIDIIKNYVPHYYVMDITIVDNEGTTTYMNKY